MLKSWQTAATYWHKFLYVYSGRRRTLVAMMALFIATSVAEAFGIALIGPFLQIALDPDSISRIGALNAVYTFLGFTDYRQFFVVLGLTLVVLFILKSVLYLFSQAVIFRVTLYQRRALQSRLLRSCLRAPYESVLQLNVADLTSMIATECMRFTLFFSIPIFQLVSNLVIILVLLLLIWLTDPFMAIASLATLLPAVILFIFITKRAREWGRIVTVTNIDIVKIINHSLGGFKEVKLLGCEQFFEDQLADQTRTQVNAQFLFNTVKVTPRPIVEALLMAFIVGVVCVSQLIFQSGMDELISSLGILALSAVRLIPAMNASLQSFGTIRNSSYLVDKIYDDLTTAEKRIRLAKESTSIPSRTSGDLLPLAFTKTVALDSISYRYPESDGDAIQKVSIDIEKGKSIAVIGKSGAGKTTLIDIILGLLHPQSGDIRVDGTSVYTNLRSWQEMIGYIPQSIFLMDDTIEQNIAFGVPQELIDHDKIHDALKIAQLEELVNDLPAGLKTVTGDRGMRLSGGQRQRIGIARALYHGQEILVLDEATSALDTDTEKLVSQAIDALAGLKTLIIIAHRMSTIEGCDRVYVLEKGKIVESGTYREVVSEKGNTPTVN